MGIVVAFLRITLELIKDNLNPDGVLFYLGDMNFLSFGAWFFLFCLIFMVTVSLLTKAPDQEQIVNLTFGTITEEEKNKNKSSYTWVDVTVSIIIVLIVIGIMVFFNGK